jgi:hypothetical protein
MRRPETFGKQRECACPHPYRRAWPPACPRLSRLAWPGSSRRAWPLACPGLSGHAQSLRPGRRRASLVALRQGRPKLAACGRSDSVPASGGCGALLRLAPIRLPDGPGQAVGWRDRCASNQAQCRLRRGRAEPVALCSGVSVRVRSGRAQLLGPTDAGLASSRSFGLLQLACRTDSVRPRGGAIVVLRIRRSVDCGGAAPSPMLFAWG